MKLRRSITLASVVALVAILLAPNTQAGPTDGVVNTNAAPGGFMSDNVTWLGNIPLDRTVGVGARLVEGPDFKRFYVTSAGGLSIYDVSNAELPVPLSHLPLPHFENEDVSVSDDGKRTLLTADFLLRGTFTYVIDTSDPTVPVVQTVIPYGAHTLTCVTADCQWIYTSEYETYRIRLDGTYQVWGRTSGGWEQKVRQQGYGFSQGAHDHFRDAAGYIITDTVPRYVLDVTDKGTPLNPKVVARSISEDSKGETAYQHNNMRPGADKWTSRSGSYTGGDLRHGEVLLSNGETNFTQVPFYSGASWNPFQNPTDPSSCGDRNGPFATWDMADFDKGRPMRPIEVFRPVTSNLEDLSEAEQEANRPYLDGNPYITQWGCSGHWFDHLPAKDGEILVAAGWYDHGTRFLSVDRKTGNIDEVGFFQPADGIGFAAYWITNDIVYTVDEYRGIDILRFDRNAPQPSIQDLVESWSAVEVPSAESASYQLFCKLAVSSEI